MILAGFTIVLWRAFLLVGAQVANTKTKQINMLTLLPITGDLPRNGEGCKAGSEVAINAFNSRTDVLPNYKVVGDYQDEGSGSLLTALRTIEFYRRTENQTETNFRGPVAIGPFFSSGCNGLARTAHHLGLVEVTTTCSAPFFTRNRKSYPNLYRSRSGSDVLILGQLKFIRDVGKWNRFAVITFASNFFDIYLATSIQREATKVNITVHHFDIVLEVDDRAIQALLASDARVVALEISNLPQITRFLCLTYKYGMTGPRYAFILFFAAYFEPDSLPDYPFETCTRENVKTQLEYAFWAGWQAETDDPAAVSAGGYNLSDFETAYLKLTNGNKLADYQKRLVCHDATLQSLLAYDKAEKVLNSKNMTLSDLVKDPFTVMRAVNDSMASIEYVGLRIPKFKYMPTLEVDLYETHIIVRWTKAAGLQLHYRGKVTPTDDPYLLTSHVFTPLTPLRWFSHDGKPPKDRMNVLVNLQNVSSNIFIAITVIAAFAAALQILGYIVAAIKSPKTLPEEFFCLLACLCLDAAAVANSAPSLSDQSRIVCQVRPILILIAFGFYESFAYARILHLRSVSPPTRDSIHPHHISLSKKVSNPHSGNESSRLKHPGASKEGASVSNVSVKANHPEEHSRPSTAVSPHYFHKEFTPQSFALFATTSLLLTGGYIVAWMLTDPVSGNLEQLNVPTYRYDIDTLESNQSIVCGSPYYLPWTMAAVGCHALLIIMAGVYTFRLGSRRRWLKRTMLFKALGLTAINTTTILLAALLIMAVLSSPIAKQVALAAIVLVFSINTSAITFGISIKRGAHHH